MRAWALAVLAALVLGVGCAPAARPGPSPTSAPAAPAPSEWDQTLDAARREGSVAVMSLEGDDIREAMTQPFERKYGISVDFLGDAGPGIPPRVANERQAGQYLWDVYVHGTTTGLAAMLPMGAFDPLEPTFILPDVKDPKTWRGGELEFLDPGRTLAVISPFQRGTLFVNSSLVQPDEIKSYQDLLDPKWRGRMVMNDPRRAGPGQATFTFFYRHPDLGPDFIRALGRQEITILRNFQQEVDLVGQGRYPILIGTADAIAEARIKQGVPITIVDPRQLKEGSDVSPANGALALFNRAPHPNAAKVYINWLLSQEGQTAFARATGYVSARLDASTDHALPWRVPLPGAIKTYDQEAMDVRDRLVRPLLEEVFGPA